MKVISTVVGCSVILPSPTLAFWDITLRPEIPRRALVTVLTAAAPFQLDHDGEDVLRVRHPGRVAFAIGVIYDQHAPRVRGAHSAVAGGFLDLTAHHEKELAAGRAILVAAPGGGNPHIDVAGCIRRRGYVEQRGGRRINQRCEFGLDLFEMALALVTGEEL